MRPFESDYHKILEILNEAQAVIGMRLHSLIFATLTHTPFLALSYSQKVDAFVKSLEMDRYLFTWETLSVSQLIEGFEELEKHSAPISQKLEHKCAYFRHQALKQCEFKGKF